jgi:outer membrane immunogenic protein
MAVVGYSKILKKDDCVINAKRFLGSKGILVIVLCLVLARLNIAKAADLDETGWFVGGQLGYSSTTADMAGGFPEEADVESYGAYGGFNFTEWFGLEGNILMTGNISGDGEGRISTDYLAMSFSPRFTYHLHPAFSIYAKAGLGLMIYSAEFDEVILFERGLDQSWSGIASSYGIGGQFTVVKGVRMRVGYDVLSGTLTSNDETYWLNIADVDAKLKQVSFSMHYQF